MDKRELHHFWTKTRDINPWYLFAVFAVSGVVCVFALRANNLHMVHLRNEVYKADKESGDVEGTLQALQAYVTSHMNTELSSGQGAVYPPIQLKYTYERLLEDEGNVASQDNAQIYQQAQTYCESQNSADFSGRNRVPCIQQYVKDHSSEAINIPDSLYKFDFVSPFWSPDLAGWSLLVTVTSFFAFTLVWALQQFLNYYTK